MHAQREDEDGALEAATSHRARGRRWSGSSGSSSRSPSSSSAGGCSRSGLQEGVSDSCDEGSESLEDGSSSGGVSAAALCKGESPRRCSVPFHLAVMGAVTTILLCVCVSMFVPDIAFICEFKRLILEQCGNSLRNQSDLLNNLTHRESAMAYKSLLNSVVTNVQLCITQRPNNSLDALWNTLQALRLSTLTWDGRSSPGRDLIWHRAWVQLSTADITSLHVTCGNLEAVSGLLVAFGTEQLSGVVSGSSGSAHQVSECEGSAPGLSTTLKQWDIQGAGGIRGPLVREMPYVPTQRPFYTVQADAAAQARLAQGNSSSTELRRLWSKFYRFAGGAMGVSLTLPVAYCGDYSCFEGVIAADLTVSLISQMCELQWSRLASELHSKHGYQITKASSSVFIVNQASRSFRSQVGLLIGSSQAQALPQGQMIRAIDSHDQATQLAARAFLHFYDTWDAEILQDEEPLDFQVLGTEQGNATASLPSKFARCESSQGGRRPECLVLTTRSIPLDEGSRWLLVALLPGDVFSRQTWTEVDEVEADARATEQQAAIKAGHIIWTNSCVFAAVAAMSVCLGCCLGSCIARPLLQLSNLMRRLSGLNFLRSSPELRSLAQRSPSGVKEVAKLQAEFAHLCGSMEVFARFVPEAVVRGIVHGQEAAARLHMERRRVTVMVSDIKDFTSISERLPQKELLYLLTLYLSQMTDIIEKWEGVVTEVLGDGLVAFWNTPEKVQDHATKACVAALEQQQALGPLNMELAAEGLPQLSVRIGVHTGEVLSGNLGSERKMKFGCLGEPLNVAGLLEGSLCKTYGAGLLCSGATREALRPGSGFCLRTLDLVQAKEGQAPFEVCEVLGCDQPPGLRPSEARLAQAELYEAALRAYQAARFPEASGLAEELLRQHPEDRAAEVLLGRTRRHAALRLSREELAAWTGVASLA